MVVHNKRFIFIRIMVEVNLVADQNLIINMDPNYRQCQLLSVQCLKVDQLVIWCDAGMMMMAQQYAMRKKTPPPSSPRLGPVEGLQDRLGYKRQETF